MIKLTLFAVLFLVFGDAAQLKLLRRNADLTLNRVSNGIPQRRYIVVFNHMSPTFGDQETVSAWAGFHGANPADVTHYYNMGKGFQGFASWLSASALEGILTQSIVKYVEEDQEVNLDFTREPLLKGVTQVPENSDWQSRFDWGQQRITNRKWNLETNPAGGYSPIPPARQNASNQPYLTTWTWATPGHYPADGKDTMIWILDTGIKADHVEFLDNNGVSRVVYAKNFVENENTTNDGNGHGTHCAGTSAGNFRGVAPKAALASLKVLGAGGSGTWAGVIAGVQDCGDQSANYPGVFHVISASLGGGAQQSVDDAFNTLVKERGVTAVVAAGNGNSNCCQNSINPNSGNSPARAEYVIAVVASDSADNVASYSSYGPCTQSIAPGSIITSAWITPNGQTGNNWYNDISGTSMATPHVSGAVALFAQMNSNGKDPVTPQNVKDALALYQTEDIITGLDTALKNTTPNRFLYATWAL